MADFTLESLHAEIVNDPTGLGYKEADGVTWKGDQVIADLLNEVRVAIQIKRSDVDASEVFHAIALGDLVNNPGASQLEWFNALLHLTTPIRLLNADGSATPVRENVIGIVRNGTATLQRLAALETRAGSRAEQLWTEGIVISAGDVGRAANVGG